MKNVEFKTLEDQVEAEENSRGVVAYQMVGYRLEFYGSVVENTFDTKIMEDGQRIVIDGDGFFPAGYRIN